MVAERVPRVRRLGRDEWRAYRALRLRALADAPDAFATTLAQARARADADWERQAEAGADSATQIGLVAEAGSRLVGLAWCRVDPARPDCADLFQMWVEPAFRRLGVARALLEAAAAWARAADARALVLSVTCGDSPARRLYEDAGFAPAGDPEPLRPGSALRAQPMRRALDPA